MVVWAWRRRKNTQWQESMQPWRWTTEESCSTLLGAAMETEEPGPEAWGVTKGRADVKCESPLPRRDKPQENLLLWLPGQ